MNKDIWMIESFEIMFAWTLRRPMRLHRYLALHLQTQRRHMFGSTILEGLNMINAIHILPTFIKIYIMMTWSNGNIFRVNGPFCGEFTGDRWIPRIKASDAELWCFFGLRLNKQLGKQSRGWWFETPSRSWWRHCNVVELDLCCHLMTCMRDTCSSLMCKTNPWISHRNTQPRKHG